MTLAEIIAWHRTEAEEITYTAGAGLSQNASVRHEHAQWHTEVADYLQTLDGGPLASVRRVLQSWRGMFDTKQPTETVGMRGLIDATALDQRDSVAVRGSLIVSKDSKG